MLERRKQVTKKIFGCLLAFTFLVGCSTQLEESVTIEKPSKPVYTSTAETVEGDSSKVDDEAKQIVDALGMNETMDSPLSDEAINGLFFQGKTTLTSDACVYLSKEADSSDAVAVFATKKGDEVKKYIEQYIESAQSNAEEFSEEEVNKMKNAIIECNDKRVVFVIASNADSAKKVIEKILK